MCKMSSQLCFLTYSCWRSVHLVWHEQSSVEQHASALHHVSSDVQSGCRSLWKTGLQELSVRRLFKELQVFFVNCSSEERLCLRVNNCNNSCNFSFFLSWGTLALKYGAGIRDQWRVMRIHSISFWWAFELHVNTSHRYKTHQYCSYFLILPFSPSLLSPLLSFSFLFTPSVPSPIPPKLSSLPPVAPLSVKVNCFLRFFPCSPSCCLFDWIERTSHRPCREARQGTGCPG